jgi:riboflavin biosynthesis pyrimidine reductase
LTAEVRQILPGGQSVTDQQLAALYAYPHMPEAGRWLRANMVTSLDGAATLAGRSGGLSGEGDRQVFAMLRSLADVIVVGAGTARAEGYEPIKPGVEGTRWEWLREGRTPSAPIAVITGRLDLDPDSALLAASPSHARTIIYTTEAAPQRQRRAATDAGSEVVILGQHRVDLTAVLDDLASRGHRRILTEGGPHLLNQFAGQGLLDELCLTLSPLLTGPDAGRIVRPDGTGGTIPRHLSLAHALADEAFLLCRYLT